MGWNLRRGFVPELQICPRHKAVGCCVRHEVGGPGLDEALILAGQELATEVPSVDHMMVHKIYVTYDIYQLLSATSMVRSVWTWQHEG